MQAAGVGDGVDAVVAACSSAPRPRSSTRQRTGPLWASTTVMLVGSPTKTKRGRGSDLPSSAIIGRTPVQPTSSS